MTQNEVINLFLKGENAQAYAFFGCHKIKDSYVFRTWAPHAKKVYVIGDFCDWNTGKMHEMAKIHSEGIFECLIDNLHIFDAYKFLVVGSDGQKYYKADPFAVHAETRPSTASKVYDFPVFDWQDAKWLEKRKVQNVHHLPMNIYEMHLGSWKRHKDGNYYDYRTLAKKLPPYLKKIGYTHVEFLPILEHPYDKSWGYQVTGYFAPTARYGTPKDFCVLVSALHKEGIGVILDWVPAHFPKDACGLYRFDGEACYEYADREKGEHPDWGTAIFDYEKGPVQSFLISSALFWIRKYHIDGLRVDAVASMLYLDYGRSDGEWQTNQNGGKENLEAISFLKKLNETIQKEEKGIVVIAEESTAFPKVTEPVKDGGLGFDFKWNMGFMHDTLEYMHTDSLFRKGVHGSITFSFSYAFSEKFVLPLSHDEVVHGKCSLIEKMAGDYDTKFSNLRSYLAYMFAHPGKKLTFMGSEFAHFAEWNEEKELDWFLLKYEMHRKFYHYVRLLNHFYKRTKALWQMDDRPEGFCWVAGDDDQNNVISFLRFDEEKNVILIICHFSALVLENYRIGVPFAGDYEEVFSTDDLSFGGSGIKNGVCHSEKKRMHGREFSISLTLPSYGVIYLSPKQSINRINKGNIS